MNECNLGKQPFPYLCCCKCSMHIPMVNDFFDRNQIGWLCIGFLVASKGESTISEQTFIEKNEEHGCCELFMDKDRNPLRGFFK